MKRVVLILFSVVPIVCYAQSFKIEGTVTGLPENSKLYLRLAKPERMIDSAFVINDQFTFKGKLDPSPVPLILFTSKYSNYVVFWGENSDIKMSLKAGSFKTGEISGSATETENREIRRASALQGGDREQELKRDANYVKTHPNSILAAHTLSVYASTWGKEKTAALFAGLSPAMKKTTYGKEVDDFITLNQKTEIGDHFADFSQKGADGNTIKLSAIHAKYILLDFWASWCGPCREDNPELVKTYDAFKQKGFEILGISLDENESQWRKAIIKDNLVWPNVSDLNGDKNVAALIYGVTAVPTNLLIDGDGIIIAKNLHGEKLRDKLIELLGKD